ncbi:PaaX family transcriptional regulator C-terminal domain-containing protein [Amycolatopsis sp. EV170708-02-1]|uniref:PaaX family transcriptional regulator n=1 Tax=Amycolatopsis sp. EV170708-02-1 TaxID=2919322 RepID=UPI001F0C8230|nr:PaaX family transcriptional regulator C-terminal domain-containing protein [Amycolatopsis sp. EV170708-02-1]UMP01088.1 PaaX family transcriptional regulator [Amycolatopsis sp. EV170708-02-1]
MPESATPHGDPGPQELVMTLLGTYVSPRETRRVWSGGLVGVLAGLGFSDGAARIALARLARRDLLARHKAGRLVHYSLTRRTIALLEDGDRRIFSLGRREREVGEWTVLWQSIPESRRQARERLVRRLRFLGFGPVQDGTWIAPHDREAEVLALLADLDVAEHAGLMLGKPSAGLDVRRFAARAWNLDGLAARYDAFVRDFGGYSADLPDAEAFRVRTWLTHTFRAFPSLDPELPVGLVPAPPSRAAAVELFHDLYQALATAAQRHFDEVTEK